MTAINPIARLIIRDGGEGDSLIIGARFKGQTFFKPGKVYEIRQDIFGEFHIKEVGDSIVNVNNLDKDQVSSVSWGSTINDILGTLGKYLFLTKKEYKSLKDKQEK